MRSFAFALCLLAVPPMHLLAGDDDPEPPGGGQALRQLRGTWTVTRSILKGGTESKAPYTLTYQFDGAKLTILSGKGKTTTYALELDTKKQPPVLLLKADKGTLMRRMAVRMKGKELHLAVSPIKGDKDVPLTFDGKNCTVLILQREKK